MRLRPGRVPEHRRVPLPPGSGGDVEQHELWDGAYTLDDLPDAAELIQVRRENEARAVEARA